MRGQRYFPTDHFTNSAGQHDEVVNLSDSSDDEIISSNSTVKNVRSSYPNQSFSPNLNNRSVEFLESRNRKRSENVDIVDIAETPERPAKIPKTNDAPVKGGRSAGILYKDPCYSCPSLSKYRCPACSTLSCSLECVKKHKTTRGCDGERDVTAFVPIEKYGDRHMFSDYHFLENMGRVIENANRRKINTGLLWSLPRNLSRLQEAARCRGTNLLIMPPIFSRRKKSSTYYRYRDMKILWHIEWLFPQCDVPDFSCVDERVDEDTILSECLSKHLTSSDTAEPKECSKRQCDEKQKCEEHQLGNELRFYCYFGIKDVTVLLRDEKSPSTKRRFFELDKNLCLKKNLSGKKIIEYPTLLVVPNMHLDGYNICDSDADDEEGEAES